MLDAGRTSTADIALLRFSLFQGVTHAISTRHGGISSPPYASLNVGLSTGDAETHVLQNRRILVERLGLSLDDVLPGRLTHGNTVSVFRQAAPGSTSLRPRAGGTDASRDSAFQSDAVISDVWGQYFLLTFADCVPLLFFDPVRGIIGGAHAGWRGTAGQIGPAVVRAMERHFGSRPRDILVGIGPSIGPCCYTVGQDVLTTFHARGATPATASSQDSLRLDLWSTNERQLEAVGIRPDAIENPRICTSCNVASFFSHRTEGGRTGRFALCLGMP